jgi:hypothetical protein
VSACVTDVRMYVHFGVHLYVGYDLMYARKHFGDQPVLSYTLLFKIGLFCVEPFLLKIHCMPLSLFSGKPSFVDGRFLKIHTQKKQFSTSNFSRILHNFSMVSFHFFTITYTYSHYS